jgi:hypothetical protein
MRTNTSGYVRLLLLVGFLTGASWAEDRATLLSLDDARTLVMKVPSALRSQKLGGCPQAELLDQETAWAFFQVRNRCPEKGSGMLGNYHVDLRTGRVWTDGEPRKEVKSAELRRLRAKLATRQRR